MIQIRRSFFETNSSSCDVFIYNTKSNIDIPSALELHIGQDNNPVDRYFDDLYEWIKECPEDVTGFLLNLFKLGVKEIECADKEIVNIFERIKRGNITENDFYSYVVNCPLQYLFCDDIHLECVEEDFVNDVVKSYGKNYSCLSIRLT